MLVPEVKVVLLFKVFVTENVGVYTGILNTIGVSVANAADRVVGVPEQIGDTGDADIVGVAGACDKVASVVYLFEHPEFVAVNVYKPFELIVVLTTVAMADDPLVTIPGPAHEYVVPIVGVMPDPSRLKFVPVHTGLLFVTLPVVPFIVTTTLKEAPQPVL